MSKVSTARTVRGGALVVGVAAISLSLAGAAFASGPTAKVSPNKKLTNGKVVKVTGKGYTKSDTIYIVECSSIGSASACDTSNVAVAQSDSKGKIPATSFTVHTGTIGNGTCGTSASDATCYLAVSNQGGTAVSFPKITFKVPKK